MMSKYYNDEVANSVADPGNRKGGFQTIAKRGVTPTSGAGEIPFSARGSPILDCVELLRTVN